MITTTKYGELKTRVKFEDIIQSIVKTNGGNVEDSGVSVIVDMFKDLIPEEKKLEIETDISEKEIYSMDPLELIKASEMAKIIDEAERVDNETRGPTR